jgi:hypothetical protein
MTVVMKIDLAGPGAALITGVGLLVSIFLVRDTGAHVALGQRAHGDDAPAHRLRSDLTHASLRDPVLRACNQAGLVNNLNDALAWGPVPLYLTAHGTGIRQIAVVAAAYRIVWGAGHLATGWLSDHIGRKPLITGGMVVQAGALGLLVAGDGSFAPSLVATVLARSRNRNGLPDLDRRRLGRQPAARPRPAVARGIAEGLFELEAERRVHRHRPPRRRSGVRRIRLSEWGARVWRAQPRCENPRGRDASHGAPGGEVATSRRTWLGAALVSKLRSSRHRASSLCLP